MGFPLVQICSAMPRCAAGEWTVEPALFTNTMELQLSHQEEAMVYKCYTLSLSEIGV
jgi:hypothetical protein